jgi:hypothetical protein
MSWLEKSGGRAQKLRKKKEKRRRKKIVIGDKSNLQSVHLPHIQGGDVEMKLKPPWNDLYVYWNQSHVPSKYD